jgi:hypothetical protein
MARGRAILESSGDASLGGAEVSAEDPKRLSCSQDAARALIAAVITQAVEDIRLMKKPASWRHNKDRSHLNTRLRDFASARHFFRDRSHGNACHWMATLCGIEDEVLREKIDYDIAEAEIVGRDEGMWPQHEMLKVQPPSVDS